LTRKPTRIDEVDTPAILIDINRVERNIERAQAHADTHGLKLRPHIKTHKMPYFAHQQMAAGAVGITCQKIGEAEVMADAGLKDIFLPYNILGQTKLERLQQLHRRVTLAVTADSGATLDGLASTFSDKTHPLFVLIECDTGAGRCGAQSPAQAVELATRIHASKGLSFGGLMTFPAPGKAREAETWLEQCREMLGRAGLPCPVVSSGGTPDMWREPESGIATEYRPGTYIFMDRYQVWKGAATLDDCAVTVLATVVSRPTETRAILDAGSKALTSDTLGLSDYGELMGMPNARIVGLSEEHGKLELPAGSPLRIGDRVRVLPDHVCTVVNLFDEVHLVSGDSVVDVLPVAARGKLT
jgi:D-serine deaminase-like pyridoxal phosphate-dependent protein